jgi:hypothetical protein
VAEKSAAASAPMDDWQNFAAKLLEKYDTNVFA